MCYVLITALDVWSSNASLLLGTEAPVMMPDSVDLSLLLYVLVWLKGLLEA